LVFAVIIAEPPRVLLVLFSVYALSGPTYFVVQKLRENQKSTES